VGLDLQEISALPPANDYWEHSFYQGIYSKSEIAYAVRAVGAETPFRRLLVRQEALRKCDRSFLGVDLTATAIEHDASGSPYFVRKSSAGDQRLPHSLSISRICHGGGDGHLAFTLVT
jgi:hypothetical protein